MGFTIASFLFTYDFVQKVWSYLLMLLVMTFNIWTLVAVSLGLTIGYSIKQIDDDFNRIDIGYIRSRQPTDVEIDL